MHRFLALAVGSLALSSVLCANTFILGSDPNQIFDNVNVGPYPGSLTGTAITSFFCLDFNKESFFGGSYVGTVAIPATQQEKEVAFLGAYALFLGSPSSNATIVNSVEGPISFAAWQIMGTLDVPLPSSSQAYIQTADYAYNHNLIPQSFLNAVSIFTPTDTSVQRFITVVRDDSIVGSVESVESAVPEPGTISLLAAGLLCVAFRRVRRPKPGREASDPNFS